MVPRAKIRLDYYLYPHLYPYYLHYYHETLKHYGRISRDFSLGSKIVPRAKTRLDYHYYLHLVIVIVIVIVIDYYSATYKAHLPFRDYF